jgi:hypothetical protein
MRTLQILLIVFCLKINAQQNDLDIEIEHFKIFIGAGTSFNNVVFNNAAGRWTLQDALTTTGDFTVTNSETAGNGVDRLAGGHIQGSGNERQHGDRGD